ncbi:hypothetical protein AZ66_30250 [Paenibacillus sp. E194]|uniref:DUF2161 family putative PD-(D/E)XK-type phosphodiesterase n=1 Tax=Paenibacillus sp. E194 TaxID=1458845 RepID=UPI0005E9723A|nr:DUF2161 family putative PD-(D/E)XK-type phosphodiesterase [Paenibacillus sp. E194]KJB84579.1 hypothetical protein AZ66_30250 [Paenibacillus sp. E194]
MGKSTSPSTRAKKTKQAARSQSAAPIRSDSIAAELEQQQETKETRETRETREKQVDSSRVIHKESELYSPIKTYFEAIGYHVRGEVRHCDMVAIRPDAPEAEPIIIELKSSFNVTLLLQALDRLKLSSTVYVAVAKKKATRSSHPVSGLRQLCERLGLGFLLVTFYKRKAPFVEAICHPPGWVEQEEKAVYNPKPVRTSKTRAARLVREFHARSGDYNVGGTTKQPLVTAYREKALRVANVLQEGPLRAAVVRSRAGVGDAASILQKNYYGWFERQSRGIYALTSEGTAAIAQYANILAQLPGLSP